MGCLVVRIRSLKPGFWVSDDIAALDEPTALMYAGLWNFAGDNGVGRDDARLIKAALYALRESVTVPIIEARMAALAARGVVVRYVVDGKKLYFIPSWSEHQRISHPKTAGQLPAPSPEDFRNPPEPSGKLPLGCGGGGGGGDGEGGGGSGAQEGVGGAARGNLPESYRTDYDNYRRSTRNPVGFDAIVADCGPGGMQAVPGATWLHVGQALREMATAGDGNFTAGRLRGFIRQLVRERTGQDAKSSSPFGQAA